MDEIRQVIESNRAYFCLDCGKCTAACPVARHDAAFSPRRIVERAVMGQTEALLADGVLWSCLTCRRCTALCPSDVRYSEFTRDLRTAARQREHRPSCSHGETIQTWMRMMAQPDLRQNRREWLSDDLRVSDDGDTVYWVGCLPHYDVMFGASGFEGVGIARGAVRVLNALGIEPQVLADERCCGHDLLWDGDFDTFRKLAELNVARLRGSGAQRVITTCPECARTLRLDYPALVGDTGMEVLHLSEVAAKGEWPVGRKASGRVTFHDPCRLGRHLGVYDAPRQLLAALGYEVVEMAHNRAAALCCGTSCWTDCGAVSKAIQVERLREARATGAGVLVTACAKCQIHFRCAMDDAQLGDEIAIEVRDLATLVAEGLD